jgi:hypothetical protein
VHLQAHRAHAARAPKPLGLLPAEIEDPHAGEAVAADAVLVESAFGAEIRIRGRVLEDAQRRLEMVDSPPRPVDTGEAPINSGEAAGASQ